jgi:hypothetical protein
MVLPNNKIFIQIAAYRDPELIHTIRSCIENADKPENLTFGICWQHGEKEYLLPFLHDKRFKIISIHYSETKGCCWARHKTQQFYDGEEYTLQLDSHHRFIKGWDTVLIQMYKQLKFKGYEKPLITAYLPSYDPENDPEGRVLVPWKIEIKEITDNKQVLFIPAYLNSGLSEPVEAKFFSGHFTFSSGQFIIDVPYDPQLYFHGEEMSMTVRAYTYGYTLFHPHIVVAWHEYTRKNRVKQWDDDPEWYIKDRLSKQHYLDIFYDHGQFGIGNERTLEEYITFLGVNFLDNQETRSNGTLSKNNSPQMVESNEKMYKPLDETWKQWINKNIDLKVSRSTINRILIDANFNPVEINMFMDEHC